MCFKFTQRASSIVEMAIFDEIQLLYQKAWDIAEQCNIRRTEWFDHEAVLWSCLEIAVLHGAKTVSVLWLSCGSGWLQSLVLMVDEIWTSPHLWENLHSNRFLVSRVIESAIVLWVTGDNPSWLWAKSGAQCRAHLSISLCTSEHQWTGNC